MADNTRFQRAPRGRGVGKAASRRHASRGLLQSERSILTCGAVPYITARCFTELTSPCTLLPASKGLGSVAKRRGSASAFRVQKRSRPATRPQSQQAARAPQGKCGSWPSHACRGGGDARSAAVWIWCAAAYQAFMTGSYSMARRHRNRPRRLSQGCCSASFPDTSARRKGVIPSCDGGRVGGEQCEFAMCQPWIPPLHVFGP